jgi:hypothetical protein
LKQLASRPRTARADTLQIYFMGLFHLGYEPNLRALLDALVLLEKRDPKIISNVTCRCEHIRPHVWTDLKPITVLPFGTQEQIEKDLCSADLLYLPMPFGDEHERFARFSISTKMVTYIGSGIPIIYHGPPISAAYELLRREDAAIFLTSLDSREIADALGNLSDDMRATAVANALRLAARDFMLTDQTRKFWEPVCHRILR